MRRAESKRERGDGERERERRRGRGHVTLLRPAWTRTRKNTKKRRKKTQVCSSHRCKLLPFPLSLSLPSTLLLPVCGRVGGCTHPPSITHTPASYPVHKRFQTSRLPTERKNNFFFCIFLVTKYFFVGVSFIFKFYFFSLSGVPLRICRIDNGVSPDDDYRNNNIR